MHRHATGTRAQQKSPVVFVDGYDIDGPGGVRRAEEVQDRSEVVVDVLAVVAERGGAKVWLRLNGRKYNRCGCPAFSAV
jgi:hypothetical protein